MSKRRSVTAEEMGRRGGKARAARHDKETLSTWAALGGAARAERHTAEELKAFAATGGRKPWKITPKIRKQILGMIARGRSHKEIAAKFGISLRAIGRVVAQEKQKGVK